MAVNCRISERDGDCVRPRTPPCDINAVGFPCGSVVKNLPAMQEMWVQSLGWEDSLEEGMATHSSILAWRIPWTEEPGGLQSMGFQRVGHPLDSLVLAADIQVLALADY